MASVAALLPTLPALPEPMRVLTLEALYGAQSTGGVSDIVAQTQSML